ncbi:UNVERIFIED_CONTAM: hypothetical protein GTU68_057695, partial [Idotea baltica]|nr:hypothetical protein [Idotea baltica]
YLWVLTVNIENNGHESVQFVRGTGTLRTREALVRMYTGEGVVGRNSRCWHRATVLKYTSGVPLTTPSGIMSAPTLWKPRAAKFPVSFGILP